VQSMQEIYALLTSCFILPQTPLHYRIIVAKT
jgi:hypothetical protein